jgi:cytidylate kinase
MDLSVIAIDGPAGSGKTAVGKRVADELGYRYVDTGAFYRALTLAARREGVSPEDGPGLARLARNASIVVEPPGVADDDDRAYRVLLNGQDVTPELSASEVARAVSVVAAHPEVRAELLPIQRQAASRGHVVMTGRDIGTVVAPFAGLKVFLRAPLPVRVSRRIEQLESLGQTPDPAETAAELAERDRLDQSRAVAPLKPAPDAVIVDTSTMTIDEEVAMILDLIARDSR